MPIFELLFREIMKTGGKNEKFAGGKSQLEISGGAAI